MGNIRKGSPRPNRRATKIYGVGIFDYNGLCTDESIKVCYYIWKDMLKRTTKAYQEKHKSYVDVTVCKEWLSFNKFKEWFDTNYVNGYALDKDILSGINKIYSPTTCCFIPQEINKAVSCRITKPTTLLNGVRPTPNGKYKARMYADGKIHYLGLFDNQVDANESYKTEKTHYIRKLAVDYHNKGLINDKVYKALMKWELK